MKKPRLINCRATELLQKEAFSLALAGKVRESDYSTVVTVVPLTYFKRGVQSSLGWGRLRNPRATHGRFPDRSGVHMVSRKRDMCRISGKYNTPLLVPLTPHGVQELTHKRLVRAFEVHERLVRAFEVHERGP